MNIISLGKTIIQNFFFMNALTRKLGEPVHLNEGACEKIFEDVKADTMMAQKFALVCNIKTMSIGFHFNTEKFLGYNGSLDLNKFFMLLHPDFMEEYLKWGRATYNYMMNLKDVIVEPMAMCSRMTIPLKLANGQYHWVLQEAMALQIDANGKMVSHVNIYTVLHEMDGKEDVVLVGHLFNNGFEVKEWTQMVWKDYFTTKPFDLTPAQQLIVAELHKNMDLSNAEIALALIKTKNTIDVQNKQIISRAKEAFPHNEFGTIKDVVRFLREIRYFEDGNKILD